MHRLNIIFWSGAALAFGAATLQIRIIDGQLASLFRPLGKANVLFFISSDCPVSNSYAPEIQRLCKQYGSKGVSCSLLYEDVEVNATSVRRHLDDYHYRGIPAAIDSERKIANRAKATITPEAVIVDDQGEIRYRGRIDNFYAALGKPRQQVTVHDLADALDAVLAGKAVATPETKPLGCFIVPPDILRK
jgi:thiol-disulfide isomerase/thioredoxin